MHFSSAHVPPDLLVPDACFAQPGEPISFPYQARIFVAFRGYFAGKASYKAVQGIQTCPKVL
jgi:hypothetical protein